MYYDVYNDNGFVMRTTLNVIIGVFELHKLAVDRIKRDAAESKPTELHVNRGSFRGMVVTVFAATVPLPAQSQDIFTQP